MPKRKCTGCHHFFDTEMIETPAGNFHSQECMIAYANKPENTLQLIEKGRSVLEKIERKRLKDRKEALRPRSWYLGEAQKWFNKFIRLRDHGNPCISCGRKTGAKMNAGHYRSVGDCPQLRFDEKNVHLQCEHCNRYRSGNLEYYRKALVEKVGQSGVDWLEGEHPKVVFSIEDLKALISLYKTKCKVLKQSK